MGSSKKQTVGYWYYIIFHHGLGVGPYDAFLEFRGGNRTAWSGELTETGKIFIDEANLWGGEKDQGGIEGNLFLLFGDADQDPRALEFDPLQHFGDDHPGYRGLATIIYLGRYGSGNPYPQKPAYKFRKIKKGWDSDDCWYEEKAEIILPTDIGPGQVSTLVDDTELPGTGADTVGANGVLVDGLAENDVITVDLPYGLTYTAWSQWGSDDNPFAEGLPWVCRFNVTDDQGATTTYLSTRYESSSAAFAAAQSNTPITLTGSTSYLFWLNDDPVEDNRGGLSLRIRRTFAPRAMNPAHILMYMRTQQDAAGYPLASIDTDSFEAAADWYYDNNFGLCTAWDPGQESVEEFEQRIQNVSSCSVNGDVRDGKWYLDIANGEYDLESLPILDDDDILWFKEKPTLSDSAVNSVSIKYFDPDKKETITTAPVEAQALIEEYGRNHLTVDMPEVPTAELALIVAQRDLQQRITPLRGFDLVVTRKPYAWRPNTYFRLQAPRRGIADMVCLLSQKSSGTLRSGAIKITALQDIFSFPEAAFAEQEPGVDINTPQPPEVIQNQRAFEAPYIDLVANLSSADLSVLSDDAGFLVGVAVDPAISADFDMYVDTGSGYDETASGDFSPTLTIVEDADLLDTMFTFENGDLLDDVVVGDAVIWDDEICRLDALDTDAGTIELARGCADTLPQQHSAGSRIYFWQDYAAADPTEYMDAETVDVKLLPTVGTDQLPLAAATAIEVTFDQRWYRPYPPGDFKINGERYPDSDTALASNPTVTWVHRDRLLQADQLIDTTAADVGPEDGTTYSVEYYTELGTTPIDSETGIIGTTTTEWEAPESGKYRIELFSVRDSLESWQRYSHVVTIGASLWSPANLAVAPKVWLDWGSDLTDVGGFASAWNNNKGSAGGSWVQATADDRPSIQATGLNSKRFLQFDGASDYMSASGGSLLDFARNTGVVWLFAVAKQNGTSAAGQIVQWSEGGNTNARVNIARSHSESFGATRLFARRVDGGGGDSLPDAIVFNDTDWHLGADECDYANASAWVNTDGGARTVDASFLTAGSTSDTASVAATIGSTSGLSEFADVSVAAIVGGSDTSLSLVEQQRLEGWAAHQCGLQSNLPSGHPFKSVPPYVDTPVLQPSFASDPVVFGFVAETDSGSGEIGLAVGPGAGDEFGILFNSEPSLSGSEGITTTSSGSESEIYVRLDDLTPPITPAEAVIMDHEGAVIVTMSLTDQTGYFDGSAPGELIDGDVYYTRIWNLVGSQVLLTGGDWSTIQRDTDTQGDKGCNHHRSWWNSYQDRWDGIVRIDDGSSDAYIYKDLAGTPTATAVEVAARNTDRVDTAWDDTNKTLYTMAWHGSTTLISSWDYDDGTDTYSSGSVSGVTVTGMGYVNELMAGSMGLASNGDIWAAVMTGSGLSIQRSQDGGATWLGSAVVIDNSVSTGQADVCFYTDAGTDYVLVVGSEDGGGSAVAYTIDITSNDSTIETPANWSEEALPALGGTAGYDNHICAHTGSNGDVYIACKCENGGSGDTQSVLLVRSAGGTWNKYDAFQIGSLANDQLPTRPVVVTDDTFVYYIVSDWDGGGIGPAGRDTGNIILKYCAIGSEDDLLDAHEIVLMTGNNFENPSVCIAANPDNRCIVLAHTEDTDDQGYVVTFGS